MYQYNNIPRSRAGSAITAPSQSIKTTHLHPTIANCYGLHHNGIQRIHCIQYLLMNPLNIEDLAELFPHPLYLLLKQVAAVVITLVREAAASQVF